MNNRPHHLWLLLTVIVAASFAVRLAALAYWGTGAIENEGVEYARIAENLRNGIGYVGIVSTGPQLVFPPLYPLLIAATSSVTRDYEWAGRLVSLILGALLPLPVFGIASHLFNRRVGIVAAILASLHPVLVNLSFSVLSEAPYVTLLLTAIYLVVRALNHPSIGPWLLVGGAFGLAHLTRQEALAAFLIAVLFALTATDGSRAIKCKRAVAAITVFLVLAAPEIVFIYKSTGRIALEGKSAQFFALGKRILIAGTNREIDHQPPEWQIDEPSSAHNVASWEPWEAKWAFYAIDARLNKTGVAMRSHSDVVRETHIKPKELFHLLLQGARQNVPLLLMVLSSKWLGAPLLPALALLGAFRRPWRRPQASSRLFVMFIAAAPVVVTFSAPWSYANTRYYFVLVPFLLIWASNGLVEFGRWLKASSAALGWPVLHRPVVSDCIIPGLIGFVLVIYPVKEVRKIHNFIEGSPSTRVEKQMGLWIGQQQNPGRIIDLANHLALAFYAHAQWVHFPYSNAELALRFLDAAQVDYVVLRSEETFTQYYADWLTRGIPDPRAERLHVSPSIDGKLVVYRWHRLD